MKHLAEHTSCGVILWSPLEADTEESLFADLGETGLVLLQRWNVPDTNWARRT